MPTKKYLPVSGHSVILTTPDEVFDQKSQTNFSRNIAIELYYDRVALDAANKKQGKKMKENLRSLHKRTASKV